MFARTPLAAVAVLSSVLVFGCVTQRPYQPKIPAQPAPAPQAAAQDQSLAHHSRHSESASSAAASPELDDASLLARKTSEYAQNVTPLLNQSQSPATRPSIVEWVDATSKHTADSDNSQSADHAPLANQPIANQPVTLAADRLKDDTSLPMILPESADHISQASDGSAASAVGISTDNYELKLQKLVHDYPRDLGNQLDYQLLRFVRDEPTPDLSDVTQLSAEDRDILLALMDGLNNFRVAARSDGNLMLNRKIQPLMEMADRLRSEAQLAIPTVAFCSQVSSYGVYRPMSSSRFSAGRSNGLIVYCEAANFTSVRGNDSLWRTRLQQEMVLYTDTGLAVWPEKPNSATFVDESRNRRHDFFISRLIKLPASLAAGKYVLKITLTDEESNRVVEASAPLEIVADTAPPMAAPTSYTPESTLPALSP